jgi:hypothetical protein
MFSLRAIALALVAVVGLALAACDNDEDPEAAETPPAEEAEPGDSPDIQEEPEPPTVAIDPVRVTYLASMPDAEDEELTVSWDPPRIAVLFDGGRVIHTEEEGTIICSAEDDDECTRLPGQQADAQQVIASFVPFFGAAATAPEEVPGAEPTDDREIAGRDAECYLVAAPAGPGVEDGGSAELCADVETGATLLYSFTEEDGTSQSVEAIEVDAPEDDDFEPTGPISEAEMPENGTAPDEEGAPEEEPDDEDE